MTFEDEKHTNLNGLGRFLTKKNEFLQKHSTFLSPSSKPIKSRASLRSKSVLDYECHGGTSDLTIFINGPKPFEPTEKRQIMNNSSIGFACSLRTSPTSTEKFKARAPWSNHFTKAAQKVTEGEQRID